MNEMIKTKSIYEPIEADDGVRILITRYYPRGVKRGKFDIWLRSLSPSPELLKQYKSGIATWEDFELHFARELKDNLESSNGLVEITKLSMESNITLLCYEKKGYNCHRYLIRDIVKGEASLVNSSYV